MFNVLRARVRAFFIPSPDNAVRTLTRAVTNLERAAEANDQLEAASLEQAEAYRTRVRSSVADASAANAEAARARSAAVKISALLS